jgi:hypothetical protein
MVIQRPSEASQGGFWEGGKTGPPGKEEMYRTTYPRSEGPGLL